MPLGDYSMSRLTRRKFLQSTGGTGVGLAVGAAALATSRRARGASASDRVRLAIVGIHGRGGYLAKKFASRADCQIAYLCDVDESLFSQYVNEVAQIQGSPPKV